MIATKAKITIDILQGQRDIDGPSSKVFTVYFNFLFMKRLSSHPLLVIDSSAYARNVFNLPFYMQYKL